MSEGFKLQWSGKVLATGDLVNARADTQEELEVALRAVVATAHLMRAASAAINGTEPPETKVFPTQLSLSSTTQPVSSPTVPQGAPVTVPNTGGPACAHGPMQFNPPGVSSKTGKPYSASWRCVAPRGQDCPAQWVKG